MKKIKIFLPEWSVSTENIVNAQSAPFEIFKADAIKHRDQLSKTYGKITFFADNPDDKPIIFIPEIARAYSKATQKNNLLIIFDRTEKYTSFVFIDVPVILEKDSGQKIEIENDKFYEKNITKVISLMLFFYGEGRQIDVMCKPGLKDLLFEIEPFTSESVQRNIRFLTAEENQKIIDAMEFVVDKSSLLKRWILSLLIIIAPLYITYTTFETIKTEKHKTLKKEVKTLEDAANIAATAYQETAKNEYYINDKHYKSLLKKKVLK